MHLLIHDAAVAIEREARAMGGDGRQEEGNAPLVDQIVHEVVAGQRRSLSGPGAATRRVPAAR
jgi:hypothetical protein